MRNLLFLLTLSTILLGLSGCGRSLGLDPYDTPPEYDSRPPLPDTWNPPPDGLLPVDGYVPPPPPDFGPPPDFWVPTPDGYVPPPPDAGPPPPDMRKRDWWTPPPPDFGPQPDGWVPPDRGVRPDRWVPPPPPDMDVKPDRWIPPPPDFGPAPDKWPPPPVDFGPTPDTILPPDRGIPLPDTGPCTATCSQMCQVLVACGLYTSGNYNTCVTECSSWPASQTSCLTRYLCAGVSSCVTYGTCMTTQKQADLAVRNFGAKVNGSTVTYQAQVCNLGQGDASGFYLDIYYNPTAAPKVKQSGDKYIVVPLLRAGTCANYSFTRPNTPAGSYASYVQVDSDGSVKESNESNNVSGPTKVTVTKPPPVKKPDLVITSMTATAGGTYSIYVRYRVTVCNNGSVAAKASRLDVYLNRTSAPKVKQTGNRATTLPGLNPGQCTTRDLYVSNVKQGTYNSYAQVDTLAAISESDETNNVRGPVKVTVGTAPGADLTIKTFTHQPYAFNTLLYRVQVCNVGKGATGTARVCVYYNRSSAPGTTTKCDQSTSVPILQPNQCSNRYVTRRNAPNGNYISWAFVDYQQQVKETNETNNVAGPLKFTMGGTASKADLYFASFSGKVSGTSIAYTAKVCNKGKVTATPFRVDFYPNQTSAPKAGQSGNPWTIVATLGAGACTTVNRTVNNLRRGRTYTSYAYVDSGKWVSEASETNNVAGPQKFTIPNTSPLACTATCIFAVGCGVYKISQLPQCLSWCTKLTGTDAACVSAAQSARSCTALKKCNTTSPPPPTACPSLCQWFINTCKMLPSSQYNLCLSTCGGLTSSKLQCAQRAQTAKQCNQALICIL